jgi:hypothetical protein
MIIDENNYAYTYLYDVSYIWNCDKPTKVVMKISLKYNYDNWRKECKISQAEFIIEVERKYTFDLNEIYSRCYKNNFKRQLCNKYDQPQLKEIICKSIGYDNSNNILYLNFDTQW